MKIFIKADERNARTKRKKNLPKLLEFVSPRLLTINS